MASGFWLSSGCLGGHRDMQVTVGKDWSLMHMALRVPRRTMTGYRPQAPFPPQAARSGRVQPATRLLIWYLQLF